MERQAVTREGGAGQKQGAERGREKVNAGRRGERRRREVETGSEGEQRGAGEQAGRRGFE